MRNLTNVLKLTQLHFPLQVRSESPSTAISVPSSNLPSQKTDMSFQFYNAPYSIAAWVVTKGTGIIAYNNGYDDPNKGQVWFVDHGIQKFFVNGHGIKGGKSGGSLTDGAKHFVVVTCLKASNGDYQLRLYLDANSDSEIESVMARDRISNTLYIGGFTSGKCSVSVPRRTSYENLQTHEIR